MERALPGMLHMKPNSKSSTGACLPISHRGKLCDNFRSQLRPQSHKELHCDSILHMCPLAITSVRHYEERLSIQIFGFIESTNVVVPQFQMLWDNKNPVPGRKQWNTGIICCSLREPPALPSNCKIALQVIACCGYLVPLRLCLVVRSWILYNIPDKSLV